MKKQLLWLLALVGFSTLFSCEKSAPSDAEEDATIKAYIAKKGWTAQATPEGVYYVTDVAGAGPTAAPTNIITVNYKGYTLNEVVFDGNVINNRPPFNALLGTDVIEGWKHGFQQFRAGGKGKLIIPSRYAYGTTGNSSIGPNEILVFEIELLSFK